MFCPFFVPRYGRSTHSETQQSSCLAARRVIAFSFACFTSANYLAVTFRLTASALVQLVHFPRAVSNGMASVNFFWIFEVNPLESFPAGLPLTLHVLTVTRANVSCSPLLHHVLVFTISHFPPCSHDFRTQTGFQDSFLIFRNFTRLPNLPVRLS